MRADQQGHRDGSPEAVEARERALHRSPTYQRIQARRDLEYRREAVRRQANMIQSRLVPYTYWPVEMAPRSIMAARNLLWEQIKWANAAYRRVRDLEQSA
jgi:hypothetical protein